MMRYFFHLHQDGECQRDIAGVELASAQEAHDQALDAARIMVSDLVLHNEPINGMSFQIADDAGLIIETVRFEDAIRFEG